jgi:hypothetical protein
MATIEKGRKVMTLVNVFTVKIGKGVRNLSEVRFPVRHLREENGGKAVRPSAIAYRDRASRCRLPLAQIRTCDAIAYGSYLG